MKSHIQRLGALALVLSLVAAPGLPTGAEAGGRNKREKPTRNYSPPSREHRGRSEAPRTRYDRPDRHHHERGRDRDSRFWPFVGGVVVGAVIGSHYDAPVYCAPPRPVVRARIFYYDCDACDYRGVGYESFCDHMVFQHRVSRCDVTRWYRPYEHGYWEDQY